MLIATLLGNRLERKATHQECVYMGHSISTTVHNLHGLDGLARAQGGLVIPIRSVI